MQNAFVRNAFCYVVACVAAAAIVPIASVVAAFAGGAQLDIEYGYAGRSFADALYAIFIDYLFALPVWLVVLLIQNLFWVPVLVGASYYGTKGKFAAIALAPLAATALFHAGAIATHSHLARLTISGSPWGPLETEIAGMTVTAMLFMAVQYLAKRFVSD
jgi:hypothetical protein